MSFWLEHFLLLFGSIFGTIQIAAGHSHLRGLTFFENPTLSYILGALIILGSLGWFFFSGDRTLNVLEFAHFHTGMMILNITMAIPSALLVTRVINLPLKQVKKDQPQRIRRHIKEDASR